MATAYAALVGGWVLLTACCWVLALMSCYPLTGASLLPSANQRGLLEFNSGNKPQIIQANLIHRDHPESPLNVPGTTFADRYFASTSCQNARHLTAAVEFNTPITSARAERAFEYIMTLYFGTPVQKFFLIVDTGSDLVWVQCKPCNSPYKCFNETNPLFDPSASSSYSTIPCNNLKCNHTQLGRRASCNSFDNCHITYAYGTAGSRIEGQLSSESISFNNSTEGQLGISNFLFGCMNNNTASFGHVDGLVGFNRGPFSLPSQLSSLTTFNVFSYCLVPFSASANLTSSLIFGVSKTNELQLVYTPILNNDIWPLYWVNMTGIAINGIDMSIPTTSLEYNSTTHSGGTIFDSGTTRILFSEDIWTLVVENLKDLITYPIVPASNISLCYNISGVQQPVYPTMTLHFSGLNDTIGDFPLSGENLFILVLDDVECLAIGPAEGRVHINIIGNIAQSDHYIETDLVNMKIGWTSKDCSLPM